MAIQKIKTASWDATLDTDVCKDAYSNADLTLTMRLGFKQINPANGDVAGTYHNYGDANEATRKIVKWTKADWSKWKSDFVASAEKFWSGKFWLINNHELYVNKFNGVNYIPNIRCKFKLIGGDTGGATVFHHAIDVVRLDKSETWFGSHSTLYDSLDTKSVQKGTDSKKNPIMQRAHVHEVGHLLGLGHVDIGKKHCPSNGNTNLSKCYGVADKDKNAIMGMGMQIRVKDSDPWRSAIVQLSKKGKSALRTDWAASLKECYPRTQAEARSNKILLTKLKR